jgi:hypothetical protein
VNPSSTPILGKTLGNPEGASNGPRKTAREIEEKPNHDADGEKRQEKNAEFSEDVSYDYRCSNRAF